MAQLIDTTQRKLLPTWNDFSSSTPELQPLFPTSRVVGDISSFIHEWKGCKNMANAGDLISAAIVNASYDIDEVIEAANYVLFSDETPSLALSKISKSILKIDDSSLAQKMPIYAKIAQIKDLLTKYPTDAILHIEIARNYLLLGQIKEAQGHVESALYFDKHNRYIVRSAARFYIHLKNHDKALSVIKSSLLTKHDPWLMASEIGVSQLLDKTSGNIKRGLKIIESNKFDAFDITELSSAIGTQELMAGAYSKSRRLLNISLRKPNSNSLAQAKWISNEDNLDLNFDQIILTEDNFWEAKSYSAFRSEDYLGSLNFAKNWIQQEPYSTRAILYAYGLSINYLRDLKAGQEIMDNALKTHLGNPVFINNYAYALALEGNVAKAEEVLSRVKKNDTSLNDTTGICLTATKGMIAFRNGDVENGYSLYLTAIEESRKIPEHPELNHSALLNFCREILLYDNSSENKEHVRNIIDKIPETSDNKEIQNLKEQIESLLVDKHPLV